MKIKLRSKSKFIPVNVPKIFNQEKINVKKCLEEGWISSEGKYVKKFEQTFSKYNKRIYGIAVSSGTAAYGNICPLCVCPESIRSVFSKT